MDTAGIRSAFAALIRTDSWFAQPWHKLGMERALQLIEEGQIVISPQEAGAPTVTEASNPYEYWRRKIGIEIHDELIEMLCHEHACRDDACQHSRSFACDCDVWQKAALIALGPDN